MILTTCAACAAPLAHTAPRCVRCHTRYLHLFGSASWEVETPITRYCNATCQHDHWRRGHKQICKRIHRGGNAEQYNADKNKEAVAVAVEKCADDTKGQTCYICTQALHWKTKEGLVRMCACRGTAGFAHVSCLAEQAKILVAEGEENNLDNDRFMPRWRRWDTCSLCEQGYHGLVKCALGWACWKTYVGRPETDEVFGMAMNVLVNGLAAAKHYEDALSVQEADLATRVRLGASEHNILILRGNIANLYKMVGQRQQALSLIRGVYFGRLKLNGESHLDSIREALNYASILCQLRHFEEAKPLMLKTIPVARRVLGETHAITLATRWTYGQSLYQNSDATLDDLREAVATLEDTARTARRVIGGANPRVVHIETSLRSSRAKLRARETPSARAN